MKKERIISCISLVFLDQLVKLLIVSCISVGKEIYVIPGFFYLTNLLNTGGAFSIFSNSTLLLGIIGLGVLFYLINYLNKKNLSLRANIYYGILMGGIVSNLIDRIFIHGVRDYIGIRIYLYDYPVFNIADMGIVIGAILILINEYRGERHGNRSK